MSNAYQKALIGLAFVFCGLSMTQKAEAQESSIKEEFRKYLAKATPGNQNIAGEMYEYHKKQICLKDLTDNSVTLSFLRTNGTILENTYSLRDKNRNGIVDGIHVDFSDGRRDVTIPLSQYGRFWDFAGTAMSTIIPALLDETGGQSCHCRDIQPLARIKNIKPQLSSIMEPPKILPLNRETASAPVVRQQEKSFFSKILGL